MIGKISGRLDMKGSDHVLIDTGGVGYLVYCSERTLAMMPKIGEGASLYTDLVVREDLLQLYGFVTLAEREWHKLLTSVQGVGAKAALAIQGTLGSEGVGRAIALGDVAAVKAAPGVGPKLAQRVVIELKDKAPAIMSLGSQGAQAAMTPDRTGVPAEVPLPTASKTPMAASGPSGNAEATADAMSALANLGYAPGEAASAVAQISADLPEAGVTELIKAALKILAPKE